MNNMSNIEIITFGCRLNSYESEVIKKMLENRNLFKREQKVILFNSCTVTREAERQLRQAIRKARNNNPIDTIIGVLGCAVQIDADSYLKMPEVDFVLGNGVKMKSESYEDALKALEIPTNGRVNKKKEELGNTSIKNEGAADPINNDTNYTENYINIGANSLNQVANSPVEKRSGTFGNKLNYQKYSKIANSNEINIITNEEIDNFEGKSRAFLQIQNGCDNACTFCLTRLARGPSRSLDSDSILKRIDRFLAKGYREIVLTGVNIGDYGKGLTENINLGRLIKKILQKTSLERLRLSSLDMAQINEDLLEAVAEEKRLMPHLHLSLQSGDDSILKLMARRHRAAEVFEKCNKILALRPDMVFGADFIAGFPKETDAMHKNSLAMIRNIPITYGHIFPYSERPYTPASGLPQIPKKIRKHRAEELRMAANTNLDALYQKMRGTVQKVLIETPKLGRLENYLQISLPANYSASVGDMVDMVVE